VTTYLDYIPIYDGDRYCLMCRHVCPVGRVTKREVTTPHGWALLIASVIRGSLAWDADSVDALYQCSDCSTCQTNCVTDRPLPAAIKAARAEVVRQGVMPASVAEVDRKLREWGNPYGPLPHPVSSQGSGPVGVFIGDATRFLRPASVTAAQTVVTAVTGQSPALLSVGRSSGYLPYALGLWDTARSLIQQTLDEVKAAGVREIITLSAEDADTFRRAYAELGLGLPAEVRVTPLMQYLAPRLAEGQVKLRPNGLPVATYHDPCLAMTLPGYGAAARQVVAALTGRAPREMFWREKRAGPCGAIGGLEFTQSALSAEMARQRIAEASETGAEILLTDDPHCAAQLDSFAQGFCVQSVIELLAEHIQ